MIKEKPKAKLSEEVILEEKPEIKSELKEIKKVKGAIDIKAEQAELERQLNFLHNEGLILKENRPETWDAKVADVERRLEAIKS